MFNNKNNKKCTKNVQHAVKFGQSQAQLYLESHPPLQQALCSDEGGPWQFKSSIVDKIQPSSIYYMGRWQGTKYRMKLCYISDLMEG